MTQIVIREARLGEVRALEALFVQAVHSHFSYFPAPVRDQVIAQHRSWPLARAVMHPRRVVLIARQAGRLIGYAIGSVPAGSSGQLYWLYVDPEFRGQNIGLSLLSRMLKVQRLKGAVEIILATHDHRRYYERQGFTYLERRLIDEVPMDIMAFQLGPRS